MGRRVACGIALVSVLVLTTCSENLVIKIQEVSDEATAPRIAVMVGDAALANAATHEIGRVSLGSYKDVVITIINEGQDDLLLSGSPTVQIEGAAGSFLVIDYPEAAVKAGESVSFTLRFAPLAAAEYIVVVRIPNNDPDAEDFAFEVSAIGSTGPTVIVGSGESSPTNADPVPIIVTFSEAVSGFDGADLSLSGGTVGNFLTSDSITYDIEIVPAGDGVITVFVPEACAKGVTTDEDNVSSEYFMITYDGTPPTVSFDTTASDPTNESPVPLVLIFSEPVYGIADTDLVPTECSVENFVTLSPTTCTVDLFPAADPSNAGITIAAGSFADAAANTNQAPIGFSILFDTSIPTVTLTTADQSPSSAVSFTVDIEFSEPVFSFTIDDVSVSNGTPSNLTPVDATNYTVDISPTTDGLVIVEILPGRLVDSAGLLNAGSNVLQMMHDATAPTGGISIDDGAGYTNTTGVDVSISGSDDSGISQMMISNNASFTGAVWEAYTALRSWSLDSGDGSKTVYVKLKDGAGIESGILTDTITLDELAPSAPSAPDLAAADDLGTSNSDNITNAEGTLTFSGNGAESNSVVSLSSSIDGVVGTTTADGAGAWSVDVELTEAVHNVFATVTDFAGNQSGPSTVLPVTIDRTRPSQPVPPDLNLNDDTGVSNSDDITANASGLTFEGDDAEPNIDVTIVSDKDGTAGTGIADGSGVYAVDAALSENLHLITVVLNDPAGNSSEPSYPLVVTVDLSPPDVSTGTPSNGETDVNRINPGIVLRFNDTMDASTINGTYITLKQGASPVSGTVNYEPISRTVTFTPDADLSYDTVYDIGITTAVKDAAGNALASPYAADFTTYAYWGIHTVDSSGHVGEYSSIYLDSLDFPMIAYSDGTNADLKFAAYNGTNWSTETVDSAGSVGRFCSIFGAWTNYSLPSYYAVGISYYDATNDNLKIASRGGSSWNISVVEDTANADGRYTDFVINNEDRWHVSYYDTDAGALRHAERGNPWTTEVVDSGGITGSSTSIASIDWVGLAIAYANSTGLQYATGTKTTGWNWSLSTVDATAGAGTYASLKIKGGDPYISYRAGTDVKYAYDTGTGWSIDTVTTHTTDSVGMFTSLDFDSGGNPHIVYYNSTKGDLEYSYYDGSNWVHQTIDSVNDVGPYASLVMHGDTPHISYHDLTVGDLKYATINP